MGFEMGFGIFGVLFSVGFLLVAVFIILTAVKGIGQWNKNNHSPRLTVPATVVAKRTNVTRHLDGSPNGMQQYHSYTAYYATFQVESGDRMELRLAGNEYGMLVEGDQGKLSFQGTRYLGFERV